ncbi:Sodium/hydrogen exchanger family-domain-containing protein [Coniella lustricola]|uniref:Sodium/hydrogen exchanger n=1 Tax=Coniella lustricola TaxID=2025994 RepID=A0A2T3ABC7_9PEZI|nr:Sodium/hydrogen exchanger family-domain-containing protein [Coniella lustricola]
MGRDTMLESASTAALAVYKRAAEETDPDGEDASEKEIWASWAIFILIMLMIVALFTSYFLQQRKVTAIHETVASIFAGMVIGLALRVTAGEALQNLVSFDYQIFFNLLLPPIILSSGYELHQSNFFRNIGTILTFAFAGTFLSAVVIGVILWLYTRIPIDGLDMGWVDAISVGATLSATDPVTILAIFNSYKVDPKLYTIIFGESILNDAIAIVIFKAAQASKVGAANKSGIASLLSGISTFLFDFFGSMTIGVAVGIGAALSLKYTYVRRFPKIESCLIVLIAYSTYFFSQAIDMSGIVSLLFCGITLKHYAYFNMSRRTQLTTKYIFQVLAQLSENFIFIYLGLSLFTGDGLEYKPLFTIVTVLAVCAARWTAVFPLSRAINWFIKYRARRRGIMDQPDELPYNYQAMLFWAGLRGAVGVALAALITGNDRFALKATVLVVVVLTVIIFGGTTARMLEILNIRTGVTDELESDDEFDIEAVPGGSYYKRGGGTGIGFTPRRGSSGLHLDRMDGNANGNASGKRKSDPAGWASGHRSPHGIPRPVSMSRKGSRNANALDPEQADLLGSTSNSVTESELDSDVDISDLPPAAPKRRASPIPSTSGGGADGDAGVGGATTATRERSVTLSEGAKSAAGTLKQLLTSEDPSALFKQLDEDFIKPHLLLDDGRGRGGGHG